MSRGRKSSYPERPMDGKRPAKPGEQRKKPSRTHGGGKRTRWLSLRDNFEGGRDTSRRLNFPWFMSPLYKEDRLKRWK